MLCVGVDARKSVYLGESRRSEEISMVWVGRGKGTYMDDEGGDVDGMSLSTRCTHESILDESSLRRRYRSNVMFRVLANATSLDRAGFV